MNVSLTIRTTAIALVLVAGAPLAATLEEVLDAHAEARGGAEVWEAVRTLTLEGRYEAFSDVAPLTIRRAAPDRYRMDTHLLGGEVSLGHDGERAWLRSPTLGAAEPTPADGGWRANIAKDAPLLPGLLAHRAAGRPMRYVGTESVEGRPCHVIEVTLGEGASERWALSTDTLLEVRRVSTTHDVFTGPDVTSEMKTYYMNFREFDGLVIPTREERHFSIRYNVYEFDEVVVNAEIDDSVFSP